MPAKAGIHIEDNQKAWIPAIDGMAKDENEPLPKKWR
jgi:hypothetical protein